MGEKGSVKELLVQGHAKVAGNGTQVVIGDGLTNQTAATMPTTSTFSSLSSLAVT